MTDKVRAVHVSLENADCGFVETVKFKIKRSGKFEKLFTSFEVSQVVGLLLFRLTTTPSGKYGCLKRLAVFHQ